MEFLILLIFLVVPGVIVLLVLSAKKANEAWQEAGRILGMRYTQGALLKGRRLRGKVDGVGVVVETYTKSSGKNSQRYTRFRAFHPRPLEHDLKLGSQGFFAGIGKMLGIADIETGDREFDGQVRVKSSRPEFARAYLTPVRREMVRGFLEKHRGATIDAERVTWSKKGLVRRSELIVQAVRRLVDFVKALEAELDDVQFRGAATPEPAVIVPPVPQVHEGLAIAEDQLPPPVPVPVHGDVEPGIVEEEDLLSIEDPVPVEELLPAEEAVLVEEALLTEEEPFADASEIAPEEPEPVLAPDDADDAAGPSVEELAAEELAAEELAAEELAEEPTAAPAVPLDDAWLDAPDVLTSLFGEGVSSFDAGRVFDERFAGRRVRWSGTLRSADAFTYDFVFGDQGGTKAVFEVHLLEADSYRETWALAVVHLPPGAQEVLRERKGETLGFEGILKKAEGFTKSVFVAEGELT